MIKVVLWKWLHF